MCVCVSGVGGQVLWWDYLAGTAVVPRVYGQSTTHFTHPSKVFCDLCVPVTPFLKTTLYFSYSL